jgi:hypothetical protein
MARIIQRAFFQPNKILKNSGLLLRWRKLFLEVLRIDPPKTVRNAYRSRFYGHKG